MYLYKNNFENIGNNGAVVLGRRFFIRTCSLFQRLFVISFSRGFCYLLRQFYMFCAVWLKVMKFTTDDPKNSLEPKVQISETFRTLLYILTFFSKVGLDKHCFSTDLFLAKTMNEIFTSFLIIIERFLY